MTYTLAHDRVFLNLMGTLSWNLLSESILLREKKWMAMNTEFLLFSNSRVLWILWVKPRPPQIWNMNRCKKSKSRGKNPVGGYSTCPPRPSILYTAPRGCCFCTFHTGDVHMTWVYWMCVQPTMNFHQASVTDWLLAVTVSLPCS